MRLIDADELNARMYRKSFETDDGRQQWNGGLWIRYKIFEEARDETKIVDAIPVSFLEGLRDNAKTYEGALMIDEILALWDAEEK